MKKALAMTGGSILALLVLAGHAQAQNASSSEARLKQLNITLPSVSTPSANFVNYVQTGKAPIPRRKHAWGMAAQRKTRQGPDRREGRIQAARQAGLIMLAKVRVALGSLDRVKRIVKVLGMVNTADGFSDQPKVVNGFRISWSRSSARRSASMPAPLSAWRDFRATPPWKSR